MIHEINVRVKLSIIEDSEELKKIFAEQLKVPVQQITEFKILKRSIDARSRNIVFQLKVQVGIQEKIPVTNHFFSEKKVNSLLEGFKNLSTINFEEGSFPRKLFLVQNKKL